MFSSGDGGVGDGDEDPATQTCITNNGLNQTKFIPGFPASFVIYLFWCDQIDPSLYYCITGVRCKLYHMLLPSVGRLNQTTQRYCCRRDFSLPRDRCFHILFRRRIQQFRASLLSPD